MNNEIKGWRPMRGHEKMQHGLKVLLQLLPQGLIGMEIGSYAGESAKLFAESGHFNTLYCVDMWDKNYYSGQQLISAEEEFDRKAEIFNNQVNHDVIVKLKMDSSDILTLGLEKLDFIYIDGNHNEPQITKDIENSIELLNKTEGLKILAGHDYGFRKSPDVQIAVDRILGYPDALFCDYSWIKFLT
jgi:predicted O-methyltransferase YrrM